MNRSHYQQINAMHMTLQLDVAKIYSIDWKYSYYQSLEQSLKFLKSILNWWSMFGLISNPGKKKKEKKSWKCKECEKNSHFVGFCVVFWYITSQLSRVICPRVFMHGSVVYKTLSISLCVYRCSVRRTRLRQRMSKLQRGPPPLLTRRKRCHKSESALIKCNCVGCNGKPRSSLNFWQSDVKVLHAIPCHPTLFKL